MILIGSRQWCLTILPFLNATKRSMIAISVWGFHEGILVSLAESLRGLKQWCHKKRATFHTYTNRDKIPSTFVLFQGILSDAPFPPPTPSSRSSFAMQLPHESLQGGQLTTPCASKSGGTRGVGWVRRRQDISAGKEEERRDTRGGGGWRMGQGEGWERMSDLLKLLNHLYHKNQYNLPTLLYLYPNGPRKLYRLPVYPEKNGDPSAQLQS